MFKLSFPNHKEIWLSLAQKERVCYREFNIRVFVEFCVFTVQNDYQLPMSWQR